MSAQQELLAQRVQQALQVQPVLPVLLELVQPAQQELLAQRVKQEQQDQLVLPVLPEQEQQAQLVLQAL